MSVVLTRCVTEPCWLRGTFSRNSRNQIIILRRIYVTDGFGHGRVVGHRSGNRAAARRARAPGVRYGSVNRWTSGPDHDGRVGRTLGRLGPKVRAPGALASGRDRRV